MRKILCYMILLCLLIMASCQKTEITETEAIELSKTYLESINSQEFIKLITNYDSPNTEKLDFDDSYTVFYFEEDEKRQKNELNGKNVWKISYSNTLENILGPYTIYLDRYSGEIYGVAARD